MGYTCYNISAFLNIARYAEIVGIDLWNYETADGRSIRKSVDFLIPYIVNGDRWPWQQIADFDKATFFSLFKRLAFALDDPTYLDPVEFLPQERVLSDRINLCFG